MGQPSDQLYHNAMYCVILQYARIVLWPQHCSMNDCMSWPSTSRANPAHSLATLSFRPCMTLPSLLISRTRTSLEIVAGSDRSTSAMSMSEDNSVADVSASTSFWTFHCLNCFEDHHENVPSRISENDYCQECLNELSPRFEVAAKSEYKYPPKLGDIILIIGDFQHLFSVAFFEEYKQKQANYQVRQDERVYCKHRIV